MDFFRNYRIGDLPDVQITNKDILVPLKALCYRDNTIAQILLTSIVTGLLEKSDHQKSSNVLIKFIQYINQFKFTNKYLASAIFDVCLKQSISIKLLSNLECQNIVKICKYLNLEAIGIQLLLKKPTTDIGEPVAKKIKKDEFSNNNQRFMEKSDLLGLMELYKNIDDNSAARGLFLEFKNELKEKALEALCCENLGNYKAAQEIYEQLLNSEKDKDIKHFWISKYLDSTEKLSEWEDISSTIKGITDTKDLLGTGSPTQTVQFLKLKSKNHDISYNFIVCAYKNAFWTSIYES